MITLNIITVPAVDIDIVGCLHTTYTVYTIDMGELWTATGWTLHDALSLFADKYGIKQDMIRVKRPFTTQEKHLRGYEFCM